MLSTQQIFNDEPHGSHDCPPVSTKPAYNHHSYYKQLLIQTIDVASRLESLALRHLTAIFGKFGLFLTVPCLAMPRPQTIACHLDLHRDPGIKNFMPCLGLCLRLCASDCTQCSRAKKRLVTTWRNNLVPGDALRLGRFVNALAMHHRLSGIAIYRLKATKKQPM